ncbi:DUF92 domain-containing protein [Niallia sp. Sow4_A1]|uniref:DUF92 domain-containing protein n=1 Tax=Niallia hominis TaxID=3133173 RepID=A0ABV1EYZ5_9BACI|nr:MULTISPECIES: DUF92 domain-containing protein [Bacillaceae]MCF2646923.1 DUF92 domain-containing protein [Niallia circulans]MCM3360891.1 DUF92 domain-containing protein [Niallia sp. MER TA 168]
MSSIMYSLVILFVSYYAYKRRSLTKSGAIAAFFVGSGIALGFGYKGLIILGAFFVSSSMLSTYKSKTKKSMEKKTQKGSRRDWLQVMANGGFAAIVGIIYFITEESVWITVFAILLAAANSDTWASEIGSLSKRRPLSIRTFKETETGTSGAVSILGTLAGLAGSFLIAIIATLLFPLQLWGFFLVFLFGFLGNVLDTLLGAFIQVEYQCPICGQMVETRMVCHQTVVKKKGFPLFNNDMVNVLSGFLAALSYLFFIYNH